MIEWVSIDSLKPNPENPNTHTPDQIDRLVELIKYQGWRWPIIVSKQSGMIAAGHGRLLAAIKMGLKEVPVSHQDFTSHEQEYAFITSDNAIASWSELDLSMINLKVSELGPDFNITLLGMKDFQIIPPNFEPGTEDSQGKLDEKKPIITQCPNCGECFDANENKPKD